MKAMEGKAMKATADLKEEHGGVKVMLGILEKVCDRLETGKGVDPQHLPQILEFLMVFVDRCHHAKEEDHLFPALEQAGVPREGGPVGVMLLDHRKGREFIRGMNDALPGVQRGDGQAIARFVRNAREYGELLLTHIDKEDDILYPMADALLSEDKDRELTKDFERVEEERIGQGKHEEFHRMMDRLKAVYPD
ncbi:MAG: hemerythrin domain-containing protein [Deltaproteobacteria bacterium]|nr:hemerythrin domain-containing protein [Candidatus Deferrimicrobiaceae bacterium]